MITQEQRQKNKETKCAHFNGMMNKACDAGVKYDSFKPLQSPCLPAYDLKGDCGKCEKYRPRTPEEIAERELAIKNAMDRMMKVTPLIGEIKKEHKGKGWQGVKECPVCGGKLHLSHSSYNGHVWGNCETKDCVRWME